MTVHGRHTGILRNDLAAVFYAAGQDRPGIDPQAEELFRPNLRRTQLTGNLSALTTQVMTHVALFLQKGDVVTNLTFVSATTAAGTPAAYWFALYSAAATPALMAQTADQENAAWAANTAKTLPLSSPQTIPSTGIYYAAIMVQAATPPTLLGAAALHHASVSTGHLTGEKRLSGTSGSSLTTTAPATIATPTAITAVPYVIAT